MVKASTLVTVPIGIVIIGQQTAGFIVSAPLPPTSCSTTTASTWMAAGPHHRTSHAGLAVKRPLGLSTSAPALSSALSTASRNIQCRSSRLQMSSRSLRASDSNRDPFLTNQPEGSRLGRVKTKLIKGLKKIFLGFDATDEDAMHTYKQDVLTKHNNSPETQAQNIVMDRRNAVKKTGLEMDAARASAAAKKVVDNANDGALDELVKLNVMKSDSSSTTDDSDLLASLRRRIAEGVDPKVRQAEEEAARRKQALEAQMKKAAGGPGNGERKGPMSGIGDHNTATGVLDNSNNEDADDDDDDLPPVVRSNTGWDTSASSASKLGGRATPPLSSSSSKSSAGEVPRMKELLEDEEEASGKAKGWDKSNRPKPRYVKPGEDAKQVLKETAKRDDIERLKQSLSRKYE